MKTIYKQNFIAAAREFAYDPARGLPDAKLGAFPEWNLKP